MQFIIDMFRVASMERFGASDVAMKDTKKSIITNNKTGQGLNGCLFLWVTWLRRSYAYMGG